MAARVDGGIQRHLLGTEATGICLGECRSKALVQSNATRLANGDDRRREFSIKRAPMNPGPPLGDRRDLAMAQSRFGTTGQHRRRSANSRTHPLQQMFATVRYECRYRRRADIPQNDF
ncbi:hypothetical protein D3C84_943980 [compost metagenome]